MKERRNFWDRNAGIYDCFLRRDMAAYERLYELLCPVVLHKTVLELATGTGLIAKHIVNAAERIEATDASEEMIREAKKDSCSSKLHFSVQDLFCLPYADKSFDVVIVSNALHIVPQPENALREIRRVLKDDGVLGCNLARNLFRVGKDVTLLARGSWAEEIRQNGLRIKDKFSPRVSVSRIPVTTELKPETQYDVIFVVLRYTKLDSILDTLQANRTKNIVFVGNNVRARALAASLPEKNVLFAFASSA